MHVVIYMTGEGEMDRILQYDDVWNGWTARPVEGTWKTSEEDVWRMPRAYKGGPHKKATPESSN
jgi:hypothetical protein